MLTIPTVTAAINPTTNGLYPMDFSSFKLSITEPILGGTPNLAMAKNKERLDK